MDTLVEKDYKKFKFLTENRDIDRNQVNKLKNAMAEEGFWEECPIIVDTEMNIIDGQHRFTACQEMGIPISYIISQKMGIHTLSKINTLQKGWTTKDFIKFYACQGNVNYIMLRAFCKEFSIQPSVAVMIIDNEISGGGKSAVLKAGEYTATAKAMKEGQARAVDVITTIKLMRLPITDKLIRALITANKEQKFSFKTFLHKVSVQTDKVYRCVTTSGYLDEIEKLYNYKNKANKITLVR